MFFAAKTFNSDISKWGVSSVTSMPGMFFEATAFNSDISKWDVSSVTNMQAMLGFTSFDSELSKWDVSRVNDMSRMFMQAKLFNGDISNWDVSSVANMDSIFFHATSFKQNLCGPEWVRSKATKEHMLGGSPGSISRTVYTIAAVFTSKAELKSAVDICFKMLNLFPTSDCSNGAHGSIVEWDVSRVTDMTSYFQMRTLSVCACVCVCVCVACLLTVCVCVRARARHSLSLCVCVCLACRLAVCACVCV